MSQPIDLEYRFMTMQDVGAVAELERLSFSTPWPHDAFVNELTKNPNARYVVVVHQNRIVAYCGMWIVLDEAHITNVAVHPLFRGKKIGLGLMIKMMGVARMFGAKSMTLEVRPSNLVARNMYTKLGFREHGVRKRYYSDNNEDAIIMWVTL
ncbi:MULTISPECIES: ribosomal protein S18-alanine N-acetyltransferase [Brevibacillus]|jgi:ribosomal-protein-alanine N-acetyltransferase|uniref:[Ribosomal protein bS18]-alanine N-acetyltransferase n=1 Tax=Brevibacillus parabrevis TaxID=54914 RepID=A0A4Y3PXB8_BREPA|nr:MULTISPECIES: ribosomal protein S18-alanine N-acetyltransferase [Brevibacillus]MBU8715650.1 ribosomal protein S18-alanine N-acetyltransferase [Brevibacillus parabrevis]MDH6353600.1 ribosomal-protein-alanine N-acetyltransferase [Brevibacillus sp. 1238]MDR5001771.1 ribosomal protein S18-alanine N-acetyltransferase [Brevibacillus parabrevis]MED1721237.1 ribosomal protein S18-alanine N-acetyltransferase [Brevibacillus parabrevis]MED2258051.1 ribosomal protein S18-alanine N-acetyltransferase [Br